jgi:hypothetical protein
MLDSIGDYILDQRFGKRKTRTFTNWDKVKSICVIAEADRFFNEKLVHESFSKHSRSFDLILFHPNTTSIASGTFLSINKKDLGFLSLPKQEVSEKIRQKEYDVLLDCNEKGSRASKAFTMAVRAKCKVGHKHLFYSEMFDLCIDLKEPVKLNDYLMAALNYLMMIKTNS